MKRLFLIGGFLAACVCLPFGVVAMLPRSGITKASFDGIQEGMTLGEVEEIFGRQLTQPSVEDEIVFQPLWYIGRQRKRISHACWHADDGSVVWITFGNDCIIAKQWHQSTKTFLDKIRRWLRL